MAVVHVVDMVGHQDQDVGRRDALQRPEVPVHRIGRPAIPHLPHTLRRRQGDDGLVRLMAEARPAEPEVVFQGERLILEEDKDLPDIGIEAIAQGKINEAIAPSKADGGFGATGLTQLPTRSPLPPPRSGCSAYHPQDQEEEAQEGDTYEYQVPIHVSGDLRPLASGPDRSAHVRPAQLFNSLRNSTSASRAARATAHTRARLLTTRMSHPSPVIPGLGDWQEFQEATHASGAWRCPKG